MKFGLQTQQSPFVQMLQFGSEHGIGALGAVQAASLTTKPTAHREHV